MKPLVAILVLSWSSCCAQIKFTEFFKSLVTNEADTIGLILPSEEITTGDMNPMFGMGLDNFLKSAVQNIEMRDGRILINKHVVIFGVPSDGFLFWFSGFHFLKGVRIEVPRNYTGIVSIDNCIFERGLIFAGGFDKLLFENSIVRTYFSIRTSNATQIRLDRSTFDFDGSVEPILEWPKELFESSRDGWVQQSHSVFLFDTLRKYQPQIVRQDFEILVGELGTLSLTSNVVRGRGDYLSLLSLRVSCRDFLALKNKLGTVTDLNELRVKNSFVFSQNTLGGVIAFSNLELPDYVNKIKLTWDQFSGRKISVIEVDRLETEGFSERMVALYTAGTPSQLASTEAFSELTQSYQTLLTIFKSNGDLESVNGCFSEMKDLQGSRLRADYHEHGGFKRYFRWRINWLMKVYTNHGTDPAQAILTSMYVIFAFSVFFFFFPSDWDVSSKSKLLASFKDFIQKNEKGYFKPFVKVVVGFLVSLLNAITLSINSFTTLGFGNIPTHGVARYFCILEGFVGWFLLGIFTVALINQVSL